jgi:hypothetical protein
MLLIFAVRDGPNGPGVLIVALQMGTFMEELLAPVTAMIGVKIVDLDRNCRSSSALPRYPARLPATKGSPLVDAATMSRRRQPHPIWRGTADGRAGACSSSAFSAPACWARS